MRPTGGGRITELVIRPFFSMFLPELTQLIQPLSGEYAGYREVFESISFPIGYGVVVSILLDIYIKLGLQAIAQVDLDRRIHRNEDTKILGRRSFAISKALIKRYAEFGFININQDLFEDMIQYNILEDKYTPDICRIEEHERPPMIEIPEYREKFFIDKKGMTIL